MALGERINISERIEGREWSEETYPAGLQCHETLWRIGLVGSHSSQRLLLYGETLLLPSLTKETQIKGVLLSTAKIPNEFSRESPYISNTFSGESPNFQANFA